MFSTAKSSRWTTGWCRSRQAGALLLPAMKLPKELSRQSPQRMEVKIVKRIGRRWRTPCRRLAQDQMSISLSLTLNKLTYLVTGFR